MVTSSPYGLSIFPPHADLLASSAIKPDVARARGYVSVDTKVRLADLGFAEGQRRTPGLLIPLHSTTGEVAGYQYRPDDPREVEGRVVKYESLPGSTPVLDVSPTARPWLRGSRPLWVTEGSRKVDALASVGLAAIGLLGVSSWTSQGVALADWRDVLLRGREVVIAFDSDVMTKVSVREALDALAHYLAGKGARVRRINWPRSPQSPRNPQKSEVDDPKVGVDDYLAADHSVHDLEALVVDYVIAAPTPLTKAPTLPDFPTNALPAWVADMVTTLAEATQTDPGMSGPLALGALGAAAGGRVEVEVRPGWVEPTNLFVAVASAPGTRKSAVFRELFAPIQRAEADLLAEARPAMLERQTERDVADRAAELARKKAGAELDRTRREELLAEAIAAADHAASVSVPPLPRLLADDVTPEAAASLLAECGGRLAIVSAEAGIFDTLAGRYSTVPNLDVALKGHAGDTLRVDRRGRPPEYVEHPALTMVLAVQPSVLRGIGGNGTFAGRGLLARFLYALPPNRVGFRRVAPDPVPDDVRRQYAENLGATARLLAHRGEVVVLRLGDAAEAIFRAEEERLEPLLGPAGRLGGIAEWGSKLMGAIARIAALLHLAGPGPVADGVINAETMKDAVAIGRYFTAHALATFEAMGADASLDDARHVLQHLRRRSVEAFTVRALLTDLGRGRFPTVEKLTEALTTLDDLGWITRLPAPPRTGRGRPPSPTYIVHPATFADTADSADLVEWGAARPPRTTSADTADSADRGAA
ncbi:DUF3987 domain-containing protein [Kineococcus rhizosphaerae]|uniref:Uncharacterized protein DUF3854 n=1 Tax=Kineococcus rhizosphaerae TaxID=559628 RepID=A0A2T0R213_9ACTN|nr:DUF3987 domain-containing protein [Kineococcus rhizosphaerae]PRY13597.1 uncharacterized protein DUF3854 [Kineococcus rhizosphaerae]